MDLLMGLAWLVPTFKTATAEVTARNFIGSVFRDVGLPDTIISDSYARFTSSSWTAVHASLIFGSQHHHNTTSKVEHIYCVIADALHAFARNHSDDWPELVSLVEFAIDDSASTLGSGYTPFYAYHGQHP